MASVASLYLDGTYARKNPSHGDDNVPWKVGSVLKLLARHPVPLGSVCEVGCGAGGILIALAEKLPAEVRFSGYEPMPEAYAVARTRETPRIRFTNAAAGPEIRERHDLVLCLDVVEHIEDCFGFLRGLNGLGRHFCFHFPLDMNAQMVLRDEPLMRVRANVGHIHYFSRSSALALLRETGFDVLDDFYTFGADGSYRSLPYRLLKHPRRLLFALAPHFTVRLLGGFSLMAHAVPAASRSPVRGEAGA